MATPTTLTHTLVLRMGDPSDDGHGKVDTVAYKTNKTSQEIDGLYSAARKMYDLDITAYCEDYEDNELPQEFIDACKKSFAAYPDAMKLIEGIESEENNIHTDEFAEMFLTIAKLMDATLEWEKTYEDGILDIGGYGLFWG